MSRFICGSPDFRSGALHAAKEMRLQLKSPMCASSVEEIPFRLPIPPSQRISPPPGPGERDSRLRLSLTRKTASFHTVSRKNLSSMESQRDRRSRRSVRLPGFDYSRVGMYFVTICAAERRCIFGEISGSDAVLSPVGEIVRSCWTDIPQHFPNVKIETHVLMPNHLHGVLTITS